MRQGEVQIEDTIFWLLFSGRCWILAHLLRALPTGHTNFCWTFRAASTFVYVVIIFLLLAKQFFMSIKLSQLDGKVRILTEQVALNEEKVERDKLDL